MPRKRPRTEEQKKRETEARRHRALDPAWRARAAAWMRTWRAKHPEKQRVIFARWYQKWKVERREEWREMKRQERFAVRREILGLLGGQRCAHCGYDKDWRALCIDHINSDGRTDEKVEGKNNQWAFKNALRDPDFLAAARLKYQVLCCNCNRIKQHEKQEFPGIIVKVPHEKNRRRVSNSKRN